MRPWPVVIGCAMIAFGLLAWLSGGLMGPAGFGGATQQSMLDSLLGVPGILLGGGVVVLLWGFTEKDARKG